MLTLLLASTTLAAIPAQSDVPTQSESNPLIHLSPKGGTPSGTNRSSGTVTGFENRANWATAVGAPTTLIDFESLPDTTSITNQYANEGLAFVSGTSDFETPPGPTEVRVGASTTLPFPMFDVGTLPTETNYLSVRPDATVFATGVIRFTFSTPLTAVGAFIADSSPLEGFRIEIFSAAGASLGEYLGTARTLPNSFIGVTSSTPFSRAVFTSESGFDSWGLDNLEFSNGELGTRYCSPGNPNSTGLPGSLMLSGSAVAADNDLTLTATNLPTAAFGFFIASRTQGFVANPGGSAGNICVAGSPLRFASQIGQTSGGALSISVDLTSFPEPPTFNVMVMAGDTFNFQLWHRDTAAGTPTSNFTDAVELLFL